MIEEESDTTAFWVVLALMFGAMAVIVGLIVYFHRRNYMKQEEKIRKETEEREN